MDNDIIKKVNVFEEVYKRVDNVNLMLKIYNPVESTVDDKRLAIIFFFGGGWLHGSIDQFRPQSEYLASKGMVAITVDYRVKSRHNVSPFECVEDGKDAVYWVKEKAKRFGIDPDRIAVSGGSSGGHIAACTAILKGNISDKREIYKIPKAMVLFNPVLDTSERSNGAFEEISERALELSPIHHIYEGVPSTIIFHGTCDKGIPIAKSADFCDKMLKAGNECTLVPYEGSEHGFFNPGSEENDGSYFDTLYRMEKFLELLY